MRLIMMVAILFVVKLSIRILHRQWRAEGLGCPGSKGSWMPTSTIHLQKFLTTFFWSKFSRNLYYFLNSPPQKFLSRPIFIRFPHFNLHFKTSFWIPLILNARSRQLFLLLFMHLPL